MLTKTTKSPKSKPASSRQPRPTRRVFTNKYKLRVLEEADRCKESGEVGALLRREGLYSSHLSTWRAQRRHGTLDAVGRNKRGPAPRLTEEQKEIERLRRHHRGSKKTLGTARQHVRDARGWRIHIGAVVDELAVTLGTKEACEALDVARSTQYRRRRPKPANRRRARPRPPRALKPAEVEHVLEVLHSEEFVDKAPTTVWAELLDQGVYLCSPRSMYRFLDQRAEVKERRAQRRLPQYTRPELMATGPRQVWSWDITFLRGPVRGRYYYLYVLMDIFSRYVVGWTLQNVECGEAARDLIRDACLHEGIEPGMLTIHADNGAAPTAMPVVNLFDRLGVTESRIRPHVSNDNCFSESLFRTCKYRPGYPDRFPAFAEAYTWCESFFDWYNLEHRHSGIAYLTPVVVHSGQAHAVITRRAAVLSAAYDRHPERFVSGPPSPPELPTAVYINPPRLMLENEQLQ